MSQERNPDPFADISSLRLSQDFAGDLAVQKVITTVPCRKPQRGEFFQVRPGEEWRCPAALIEDVDNREQYLVVGSALQAELAADIRAVCLYLCVNRQGSVFLWPAKLPNDGGRPNSWNESALRAAKEAESAWIRMQANMSAGMYDVFKAIGELPAPDWPDLRFNEILKTCFAGRLIESVDHVVLMKLRGEI